MLTWGVIKLGRNDRGVLVGQTGCGKTTLAEFLMEDADKKKSIAWDPKGSESIARWNGAHTRYTSLSEIYDAGEIREEPRLIYTPNPFNAEDQYDQDSLFSWVYERGYTRLYIDEATSLAGGAFPSRYLTACLNRGRERGISTLVATQRPARIPLNILSEAQHYYVFKLILHADRKRLEELTGIDAEEQATLREYEFFYWSARYGRYHNRIKLNLRGM